MLTDILYVTVLLGFVVAPYVHINAVS